ncbi:MAG TPA: glycosyltransferase [Sedimentisphaerales bacterium]|nr:glycosyltransferase [Sedimentisphaerales bacterium]HRS09723.1 glycosyltransferase [Sedimentisphaerales bacterium]HRV46627.1 glycosyltransferase [Sedimentisphaerales bacterium]
MVTASISRNAGGIFHSVRRLSAELARACRVEVVGLRDAFSAADADAWRPLVPELFERVGPRAWGYSPGLKARIGRNGTSLIHACGLWMYPTHAAAGACRRKGAPLVVSPHGMLDPWALRNSGWKKKLAGRLYEKRNLRSAACIHALCESEYESIRAYGLTNPVAIIPNGIDLPQAGPKLPPPWSDRIASGRRVMLFLGRIHPKKGLPNLIGAWGRLKAQNATVADESALVVAGWDQGGHEDELKKMVSAKGLDRDVLFLGPAFDDAKRACLQNADAFILPSFSEGLPMSVLEAWSYGLPVVMTGQCNLPEGFAADAAVEVRPEVDSIADGLERLLAMPDADRRHMGSNGRDLVASQFTWSKIAAQMIEVYKWVLGEGPQPDCVRLD